MTRLGKQQRNVRGKCTQQ
jgi:hypothetical protein